MDTNFWKTEANVAMEVKKLTTIFKWWLLLFLALGGVGCALFALKPFFGSGRQVPLMCWVPGGNASPYYEIVFLIQLYGLYTATIVVGGFEFFYTSIILRYVVQFKLLRYELERLIENDGENVAVKFKKCVEHHEFLLAYVVLHLRI